MALRQLTGLSSPRITPNRSPEHAIFAMLFEYFSICVIVFLSFLFLPDLYPICQIPAGKKTGAAQTFVLQKLLYFAILVI